MDLRISRWSESYIYTYFILQSCDIEVIHFECAVVFVEVNLCSFSIVCLYLYCHISDWESWDPINQFNPVTYLCLSQAGFGFQTPYVVVFIFVFGGLRWEVVVHFVDIGGIVHHHCLNCLFIICINLGVVILRQVLQREGVKFRVI